MTILKPKQTMSDDKIIDDFLFELSKHHPNSLFYRNYLGTLNIERDKMDHIIRLLESENLAELQDKFSIKITKKGITICNNGGWLKYLEEIKIENKKQNERIIRQDRKEEFELKLASWQVKTFWWIFGFAIIGGICGIISLIMQLVDKH